MRIEGKLNSATFKRHWGADDLQIIEQFTYLSVDISKDYCWDTLILNVSGKGKSPVGKMDAVLTDAHVTL